MRFLYVVPLIFALASGNKFVDSQANGHQILLREKLIQHFGNLTEELAAFINDPHDLITSSSANLNAYVDALLPGVNKALLEAGLDPTSVEDQKINIGIGKATLTEGEVSKLATIERYEDVTLSFDDNKNKLAVEFILRWQDVQLVYKYHTKVVLISITGHVTADVEHMKVHLKLGFDLNTSHVTVDSLDFKHTGDIKLKFSGHGLVDKITNAMTKVFTSIFHNLIIRVVKKIAMDPVQHIVDGINTAIDHILHPTSL